MDIFTDRPARSHAQVELIIIQSGDGVFQLVGEFEIAGEQGRIGIAHTFSSRRLDARLCRSTSFISSNVTRFPSRTTNLPPITVKSARTGWQKTAAATGSCSAPA